MAAVAEAAARGAEIREVSVGSTPTARASHDRGRSDGMPAGQLRTTMRSQVSLGTCGLEDCAMTVVATVVSVPA